MIQIFNKMSRWNNAYSNSKSQKYSNPLSLSHFKFTMREMIALFLLIFAFQNTQATEEADLRKLVNSLQMNINEMGSKMTSFETKVQSLENEIKVRVVHETVKVDFMKLRITPIKNLKTTNENLKSIVEMKEIEESVLIISLKSVKYFVIDVFENQKRPT